MYVCAWPYKCTLCYMRAYVRTYVHIDYVRTCVSTCVYVCINEYALTCVSTCTCTCYHICMCTYVRTCRITYMYIFETIFATILLQTYLDRIKWSDTLIRGWFAAWIFQLVVMRCKRLDYGCIRFGTQRYHTTRILMFINKRGCSQRKSRRDAGIRGYRAIRCRLLHSSCNRN